MTTLYAQPYDVSAVGFYFETGEEYEEKAAANFNDIGLPVEEYELQFIDGEEIDSELFTALRPDQTNFGDYLDACVAWSKEDKQKIIIAVGECGHIFDLCNDTPDDVDMSIYLLNSLKELAEMFIDEGLYGIIPDEIANYIDYEAIARDLRHDYHETKIAGTRLIYRYD